MSKLIIRRRKVVKFFPSLSVCFFATLLSTGITYAASAEVSRAPVFRKNPNTTERNIPVPISSSEKLDCSARGHPKPTIKWYKFVSADVNIELFKNTSRPFVLTIRNVVKNTKYMCNVSNALGYCTRTFKIKVFEYIMSKPLVQDLVNVTAREGETARLSCMAAGDALPHFVFYKWTNTSSYERVLHLEGLRQRISVKTKSAQEKTDFFKHYLTIYNTTSADAGKYTCAVGNSQGTVKRDTFLSITSGTLSTTRVRRLSTAGMKGWLVAVIVAVVLLSVLVLVLIYRRYLQQKLTIKEEEMREMFEQEVKSLPRSPVQRSGPVNSIWSSSGSLSGDVFLRGNIASYSDGFAHVTLPLDSEWEIDRRHFRIEGELGEGAFGRVLKATAVGVSGLPAKHTVAIKTLKENATEVELADLLSEMSTMKNIGKHKNIVNLIGCCTQNGPLYMVIEYAKFGNLREYLRYRRPTQSKYVDTSTEERSLTEENQKEKHGISMIDLVSFAFQIARGMEYLQSKKCVHRDLAARNILVSEGKVLKIADFGLARDIHAMDYYRKTTDGRLPVKWMAIEALFDRVYSSKSDVWGFGVVLWEIMTFGGTPYPSLPVEDLFELLQSGYRMEKPLNCPQNIHDTMLSCWAENPASRPSFTDLVNQFDAILTAFVSSEYVNTGCLNHVRLSFGTSEVPTANLAASSNESVFQQDVHVHNKQSNTEDETKLDENSNTTIKNNNQDTVLEHERTRVVIEPTSPYEFLSRMTGPRESDV